mmetsp:Transcript_2217/g.2313  ORF Transcript_2217/g.2313 Transcript_2217/m.2313 type:complete len:102 (-) Transcript_2217:560-865(-)
MLNVQQPIQKSKILSPQTASAKTAINTAPPTGWPPRYNPAAKTVKKTPQNVANCLGGEPVHLGGTLINNAEEREATKEWVGPQINRAVQSKASANTAQRVG